jgi:hypothetical protein
MSTLSQFFSSRPNALDFSVGNVRTYAGGINICYQGSAAGVLWVVSPFSSEVSRCWYCRDDAVTRAQAVTGCTTWFVPTVSQLLNPGYACRQYWDSFSAAGCYWSSQAPPACVNACFVNFNTGAAAIFNGFKGNTFCARAFRCVTY